MPCSSNISFHALCPLCPTPLPPCPFAPFAPFALGLYPFCPLPLDLSLSLSLSPYTYNAKGFTPPPFSSPSPLTLTLPSPDLSGLEDWTPHRKKASWPWPGQQGSRSGGFEQQPCLLAFSPYYPLNTCPFLDMVDGGRLEERAHRQAFGQAGCTAHLLSPPQDSSGFSRSSFSGSFSLDSTYYSVMWLDWFACLPKKQTIPHVCFQQQHGSSILSHWQLVLCSKTCSFMPLCLCLKQQQAKAYGSKAPMAFVAFRFLAFSNKKKAVVWANWCGQNLPFGCGVDKAEGRQAGH